MTVKKIFSTHARAGYQFDDRSKKYYSYQIDFYENGRRIRERGFLTKKDAEDAVAARRVSAKQQRHGVRKRIAPVGLAELFNRRLELIDNPTEKTRSRRVFSCFLDLLEENIFVREITAPHLRLFLDKRLSDKVSAATVTREITCIAAALHAAADLFPELDAWICPKIPRPRHSQRRRERVISDAEKARILQFLNFEGFHDREKKGKENDFHRTGRLRAGQIFEFALLTGLRHGEICKLRKQDFDQKNKSLKVIRWKTDTVSYLSPLTPRMIEILQTRIEQTNSEYLFSDRGKNPNTFYHIIKRACSHVGVVYGRNKQDGFVLHDARHSFISKLLQSGIDLATIQSLSGHSTPAMLMHYGHASPESKRRAMDVIEETKKIEPEIDLTVVYWQVKQGEMPLEVFLQLFDQKN